MQKRKKKPSGVYIVWLKFSVYLCYLMPSELPLSIIEVICQIPACVQSTVVYNDICQFLITYISFSCSACRTISQIYPVDDFLLGYISGGWQCWLGPSLHKQSLSVIKIPWYCQFHVPEEFFRNVSMANILYLLYSHETSWNSL